MNQWYNVVCFWGNWDDYRIEVLNKERLSSYHVNPYSTAVYCQLDEKIQLKILGRCNKGDNCNGLNFKIGLSLVTTNKHEWSVVSFNENIQLEKLTSKFEKFKWDSQNKKFLFSVPLEKDLVEEGVKIAEYISGIFELNS